MADPWNSAGILEKWRRPRLHRGVRHPRQRLQQHGAARLESQQTDARRTLARGCSLPMVLSAESKACHVLLRPVEAHAAHGAVTCVRLNADVARLLCELAVMQRKRALRRAVNGSNEALSASDDLGCAR